MRIGFFITARLKSTRLKQKILLDLNGKPVIDRVIERCKSTIGIDGVVLCTSTNPQDSVLFDHAQRSKIQFYAGSENDVLQRLLDAANYFHYDAFVSITADNPLFSIYTSQILVERYKTKSFDFGFTTGLPIGIATALIRTKALEVAVQMKKLSDTEVWGPFVNRPDFFNIFNLIINNSQIDPTVRLTLDYPKDYELLNKIYSNFGKSDIVSIQSLFKLLSNSKGLLDINKEHKQFYPPDEQLKIIKENFDNAVKDGLEYAQKKSILLKSGYSELPISL